jgi:hypothetical protein
VSNPEFDAFTKTVDALLAVPHSELKKRMDAYRAESLKNPNRRGPKPKKRKPTTHRASASRDSAAKR